MIVLSCGRERVLLSFEMAWGVSGPNYSLNAAAIQSGQDTEFSSLHMVSAPGWGTPSAPVRERDSVITVPFKITLHRVFIAKELAGNGGAKQIVFHHERLRKGCVEAMMRPSLRRLGDLIDASMGSRQTLAIDDVQFTVSQNNRVIYDGFMAGNLEHDHDYARVRDALEQVGMDPTLGL